MVRALHDFKVVRKRRTAHPLLVYKDRRHAVEYAFFNLVLEAYALDVACSVGGGVVASREHADVHLILDALPVADSARPVPLNLVIVAPVMIRGSREATLAFFVNDTAFLVLNDQASEFRLVVIAHFLHHLVAVDGHFLIDDVPCIDVVFDEFLDAPELQVLVHELGDEVIVIVDHLENVLIQSCLFARDRPISQPPL